MAAVLRDISVDIGARRRAWVLDRTLARWLCTGRRSGWCGSCGTSSTTAISRSEKSFAVAPSSSSGVRLHRHGTAPRVRSALRTRSLDLRQHLRAYDGDGTLPEAYCSCSERRTSRRPSTLILSGVSLKSCLNRYLNGIAEPSQRAKMAESGRRILQFVAGNDFKTAVDPILFQSEVRPMAHILKPGSRRLG